MPVYIRNNFKILYIHVPKTGGTSLEHFFIRNGFGQFHFCTGIDPIFHTLKCSYQHFHGDLLKAIFKLNSFDLIIMTVRNPLDRIISEYKWRKINKDFDTWVRETFEMYKKNPFVYDNHIRPQYQFEVENTKVFKLEEGFEKIIDYLEKNLKISFNYRYIPVTNKSKSNEPVQLSEDTKNLIQEFYKEDFVRYGYEIL